MAAGASRVIGMRRKGIDLLLAILLVAGLIYGASQLGDAVTRESKEGIAGDPGAAQTTTSDKSSALSDHRTQIRIGLFAVAAFVGIAILLSAVSAFIRRPRHRSRGQHSRAPRR
jgi:hypothetical protein